MLASPLDLKQLQFQKERRGLAQVPQFATRIIISSQGRGSDSEAYKWYLLADAQGREVAKPIIIGIKHRLTAEQRAQGERRAREWKPQLPPTAK